MILFAHIAIVYAVQERILVLEKKVSEGKALLKKEKACHQVRHMC